jgi:GMP synthase (glutamine-hydrolysing)
VSGKPLLVVEHEADAGPGRLAPHLAGGTPLDVRRPYAGDPLPGDADEHAGVVVLGGEVAAWEDDRAPWLPATRRLLARATADGVPVLGVCLGAQLLAMACGGRTERGGQGLEVGLTGVRVLPEARDDPFLARVLAATAGTAVPGAGDAAGAPAGDAPDFVAPQYHRDAITELPPDSSLLAVGDVYRIQAFRVGESAWGVQYHPEVSDDDFATWTVGGHASLVAEGLDPAALLASVTSASAYLDTLAAGHGDGFRTIRAVTDGRTAGRIGR